MKKKKETSFFELQNFLMMSDFLEDHKKTVRNKNFEKSARGLEEKKIKKHRLNLMIIGAF